MKKFKKLLADNLWLFRICYKAAPGYMICYIIEAIRNELVVFLEFTLALNFVLECAEFGRPFEVAATFLLTLLAFVVLGLLFNAFLYQKLQQKAQPKIKQAIKEMMFNKAKEIDLECYDNPEFYNDYVLSVSEVDNQIGRIFTLITNLCTGLVSIVLSGAFFIGNDPVSFIFIAISFAASLWSGKALNKLNFKIRNEKNPHERKLGYVNRVFYLNDYAKEVRLNTEVSDELLKDFDETNDKVLNIDKKNAGKRFGLQLLKDYICNGFLIDVVYMVYLVYSAAVLHRISYSNVAVMRGTANRMKNRMRQFSDVIPKMEEISMYVEKMKNFLDIQPKIVSTDKKPLPEKPTEIELRNVSFGYNEKDGYILNNVSMKINPYSKIAIVGYNGAGKTTLTNLILRLYDVTEGKITVGDTDIKEWNIRSYHGNYAAVFQDFSLFGATLGENVAMHENPDKQRVLKALEESSFNKELPDGTDSVLLREFDDNGVSLSGGEAQKVAVARAFYKDCPFAILDEPSANLDPVSEYALNEAMARAAENKTVIFISHRLSTTVMADVIYMLEKGEIVESGTHEELMALNGKYAYMFNLQAEKYKEEQQ